MKLKEALKIIETMRRFKIRNENLQKIAEGYASDIKEQLDLNKYEVVKIKDSEYKSEDYIVIIVKNI